MSITTTVAASASLPCTTRLPYIIYAILERTSGKYYAGLTTRTLPMRVSAHRSQTRRNRWIRAGGLMAALRRTLNAGKRFENDWDRQIVERSATTNEAHAMERHWIAALSATAPSGFDLMPCGSSVGGPDNVVPVTVAFPDGCRRS